MVKTLVLLICAHVIADFLLQPDSLVTRKRRLPFLALHAAVHAAVAYLVVQAWTSWQIPVLVLLIHGLIDLVKQRLPDTATTFLLDQGAHLASLAVLTTLLDRAGLLPEFAGVGYRTIVVVAGFVATVQAASHFIAKVTQRIVDDNGLELEGLVNGGKKIGQLERALIFLLVFISQPAGIGFLVAAKSILRFGDTTKEQKLAEYVLIGTLLSFSLAILLAYLTRWALSL